MPEALDCLSPEERDRAYKMLRLKAVMNPDEDLEITGALGGHIEFLVPETISRLNVR